MAELNKTMLKCSLCNTCIDTMNYLRVYTSSYNSREYKLYHCPCCGLEFWNPLEMISRFYESEFLELYTSFHRGGGHISTHHKPFFYHFSSKNRFGKLLDVGCGNGCFLRDAGKLGFEVYGLDSDKKSIECAIKNYGLARAYNMNLDEFILFADKNSLKFDVVTCFEVLEHQDKPREFLKSICRLIGNGGYIAGTVPNRDRLLRRLDRKDLLDYPPHHFLWLSKDVLRKFLAVEGFSEIEFYPVTFSLFELAAWLENKLTGSFGKKLKKSLKRIVVKDENKAKLELKVLENLEGENFLFRIMRVLGIFRNVIFLPLAIILLPVFNRRGYQIYFQAKLADANLIDASAMSGYNGTETRGRIGNP